MASIYSIVGWRAWYSGGRKFDSATTAWKSLPEKGVIGFVLYQREKQRRRIMTGVTLYWQSDDLFCCDNTEDADIPEGLDSSRIKRGKWVSDEEYGAAQEEMRDAMVSPTNEETRI